MTTADTPDTVGGYRIVRRLRSSELGVAYLARHPVLPREDVVTVVEPRLSESEDFAAGFAEAVEVSSVLSHPNIVPVYTRGRTARQLWVATQFADGGDLETRMHRSRISPGRAAAIVTDVAKALDYARLQGIAHGGVQPGAVVLSSADSGSERVMLGDFGYARALDAAGWSRRSRSASPYSAPEVLAGAPFDSASDVYSLGCVLLRLWTGRMPELGSPLAEATAGLPPACTALLTKALATDPAARFGSAAELADAATAAVPADPGPVLSQRTAPTAAVSPTSPLTELPTARGSRRRWLTALLVVLVAGAVGVAVSVPFSGRVVNGTAVANDAPPTPVTFAELKPLLLEGADLTELLGVKMKLKQDESSTGLEPHDNAECAGAFVPAESRAYFGSGYLGIEFQRWEEEVPPEGVGGVLPAVSEAVAAFPSALVAQRFWDGEAKRWNACTDQRLTLDNDIQIVFTDVRTSPDGTLTLKQTSSGGLGIGCGRALRVRNNVVIDVAMCFSSDDPTNAAAITNRIAERGPE